MTIPCILLFAMLCSDFRDNMLGTRWAWFLISGGMIAYFIRVGMKFALQAQWRNLGIWWFISCLVFFIFSLVGSVLGYY